MSVDLSTLRAGDKVILRDGSKIMVRMCSRQLMVFMSDISIWQKNGEWAPETYPNNPFDIVGIIHSGKRNESNDESRKND